MSKKFSTLFLSITMGLTITVSNAANAYETEGEFYCKNSDHYYIVTVDEDGLKSYQVSPPLKQMPSMVFDFQEGETDLRPWKGVADQHGKLVARPLQGFEREYRMGQLTDYAFSINKRATFLTLRNSEGIKFKCSTDKFDLKNM